MFRAVGTKAGIVADSVLSVRLFAICQSLTHCLSDSWSRNRHGFSRACMHDKSIAEVSCAPLCQSHSHSWAHPGLGAEADIVPVAHQLSGADTLSVSQSVKVDVAETGAVPCGVPQERRSQAQLWRQQRVGSDIPPAIGLRLHCRCKGRFSRVRCASLPAAVT